MAWRVEVKKTAQKQITKLDHKLQADIIRYLRERVQQAENPRQLGKALHGEKKGLWRYRVGDYRLICDIQDSNNAVVVLAPGRRKEAYR